MKFKMNKQKLFLIIKVVVSGLLIIWLAFFIDWQEVKGYFLGVDFKFVFYFLIFYILGITISARKWQVLAQFKNFKNRLWFYVEVYLIGIFINSFLPSFIGGDGYRIYRLGDERKKFKNSSSTVIVDRLSGLLGLLILSIIFGFLNFNFFRSHSVLLMLWFGCWGALFCFIFLIILSKKYGDILQLKLKFIPKKVYEYLEDFASFGQWKIIVKFMNYSFLFSFVGLALANFTLFQAVGIEVGVVNFLSVIFLSSLITTVPFIGVKEWAYITLFAFFGIPASAVITVALLSRILQMLVSLTAWPLYLKSRRGEKL
jgi:uncharacterized protein (TIRG00374 family)